MEAVCLQANELLIKPAVFGVENVLESALTTPTLEKVVVTSSVGAIVGSKKKLSQHHLHNEADWNEEAAEDYQPYSRYVHPRLYQTSLMAQLSSHQKTLCPTSALAIQTCHDAQQRKCSLVLL